MIFALFLPMIQSQKHRGDGVMPHAATARGLVYTTSTFQKGRAENKTLSESRAAKIIKNRPIVTNFG
jgi:hypothetical protein